MRRSALLVLGFLCALAALPVLAGPPDGWPFVRYEDGMPLAIKTKRPVFILFGLEPCPFCDQLNARAFSNKKLQELYSAEYVLIYMEIKGLNEKPEHVLPDGTTVTHREFVRKHRAWVAPAWAYYDRSGVKVFQGAGSEETAENFFNFHRYVAGEYYSKGMTFNQFVAQYPAK
jgi:thioredoxin-related protein